MKQKFLHMFISTTYVWREQSATMQERVDQLVTTCKFDIVRNHHSPPCDLFINHPWGTCSIVFVWYRHAWIYACI